ncbi:oligopeptide transport ATP-binding protein OppF [Vibrio astriarenae]|nr:oligopeptide transport ATP-binding protein OppF [Vibrio sp. C7]
MSDLITINNLVIRYMQGGVFRKTFNDALKGVSLSIQKGDVVGLVGESGSGKSTLGRALLGLIEPHSGQIDIAGVQPFGLQGKERMAFCRKVQMVFQDTNAALNPKMTVGAIIREGLDIHKIGTMEERDNRVTQLMNEVGLNISYRDRFPHILSGGQRQRINIARALALDPEILIADEPVSALDVSIQRQVMDLLKELQSKRGLTMIFISHDLGVVKEYCNNLVILQNGEIMESGDTQRIFSKPESDYTQMLLDSIPIADPSVRNLVA